MWTSSQLKRNARAKLKNYYWNGVLVCLILALLTGGFGGGNIPSRLNYLINGNNSYSEAYTDSLYGTVPNQPQSFSDALKEFEVPGFEYSYKLSPVIVVLLVFAIVFGLIIGLAFTAFLASPIIVGVMRYFLMASSGKNTKIGEIFYAFRCGHYLNIVKIMFLMNLKVFLWGLLFIIPGIVKSYEYLPIAFILSEDPGIDSHEVFELTREMTYGDKGNIFILMLSFIGWYFLVAFVGILLFFTYSIIGLFLGSLVLLGGGLLIMPYIYATQVELYFALKAKIFYRRQGGYDEVC